LVEEKKTHSIFVVNLPELFAIAESTTARVFFCILLTFFTTGSALANLQRPSMKAVKTEKPPVIDGILDDECWALADVATGFTDRDIEKPAKEQTFVRVLYDDVNLYVAFECLEPEPDKIQATNRKYDRYMRSDDGVAIQLDTFLDRRSSYIFMANTLGTKRDAKVGVFSGRKLDISWDCDWTVATSIAEDRWFAEIAIPIGVMHHIHKDNVTWGVAFHREEKGLQEDSTWSYPGDDPFSAREFGTLTGLDLSSVKVPRKPQFETYVSSTAELGGAGEFKFEGGKNEFSTGLDMAVRFDSQWITAFAINPDFGQVEADPDTIELRDTERFLQEERPFFQEGAELFQSPINIYYSRRFLDVDWGAKITGQGQDWSMGLIGVQGAVEREDEMIDGTYYVGRLIRNVGQDSHVGAIWSASDREDGRHFVLGADSKIYLDADTFLMGQFLTLSDSKGIETDDDTNDETDQTGRAMYFAINGGRKPWSWNLNYRDISRGFQPDLGYIPRRNIRGPGSRLSYKKDLEQGPLRSYSASSFINFYSDDESRTVLHDYVERVGVEFRNNWDLRFTRGDRFHSPFRNWYNQFRLSYNRANWWKSVTGSYQWGIYENEPYEEVAMEKPLQISDRLTTSLKGNYRLTHPEGGDQNVWLWRWITEYTFLSDGRIKFTAEETSEKRYNLTLLFYWPFGENVDFYLVLNDFRTDPDESARRGLFTKLVYRF
jgi:hypothetical protein